MKRWIPFLLVLLLAGCGAEEAAPAAPEETAAPAETAAETMTAVQVRTDSRSLTEEEVLAAYQRAVEAYGWFERTPLPDTGETATADGCVYRRVDARGLQDLEDLRIYLCGLFSPEVTERLLATGGETAPLYRDIDGALCVTDAGGDRALRKGAVELQVVQAGEGAWSVHVTVELLDQDLRTVTGLESWSFPYEYVDGRWVFTDFALVD